LVDPVSTLNCATLASGSAASALMSVVLALARFTSDDALPPKELPPQRATSKLSGAALRSSPSLGLTAPPDSRSPGPAPDPLSLARDLHAGGNDEREPRSTNVRIASHGGGLTARWVRRGDGKTRKAPTSHFARLSRAGYGDPMIEETTAEERIKSRLSPEEAAQVRALAALFMGASPAEPTAAQPPHLRPEVVIPVTRSDAKAAGGADLIHRTLSAVVSPDAPDVRAVADEVVSALKNMAPRSAVEGGLAGLFVAAQMAAFDCYRLARLAGFETPIGEVMLRRADKMTCRATELADALSRQRSRVSSGSWSSTSTAGRASGWSTKGTKST
jgi:hypothetical protein